MKWRQPTRKDHERFCQMDGWRRVQDASDRGGTHHVTYGLALPEGGTLRTRISHPVDHSSYSRSIWSHILRDQLRVSEETFWACVRDGVKPDRGVPLPDKEALPADMVNLLITRVGLSDEEVAEMTKDEAIARLQRFWTNGG